QVGGGKAARVGLGLAQAGLGVARRGAVVAVSGHLGAGAALVGERGELADAVVVPPGPVAVGVGGEGLVMEPRVVLEALGAAVGVGDGTQVARDVAGAVGVLGRPSQGVDLHGDQAAGVAQELLGVAQRLVQAQDAAALVQGVGGGVEQAVGDGGGGG